MRSIIILLLSTIYISACSIMPQSKIDADEQFALLDTPDVIGINSTLEKSAYNAMNAGDYKRAVQFYKQLVDTKPKNVMYQIGIAEALRKGGAYADSIKYYDNALSNSDSVNIDALEGKAIAIMSMGKPDEAGQMFKQVSEYDSGRWRTLNALGILFAAKGRVGDAMSYFKEAMVHNSTSPAILNNMGLSYAINGDFHSSLNMLQQASSNTGGNELQKAHIDLNKAMVYGIAGNMDKAKSIAEKYVKGPALENNLGLYASLSNNPQLAKSYLNMALSSSIVFYEKAWKNLDIIKKNSKDEKGVLHSGDYENR